MIARLSERLKLAALLTAPLVAVEMPRHLAGLPPPHRAAADAWTWFMAAAATVVVGYCGWPLLVKGWQSYRNRRLNMFSMIAPGVLITYAYSLAAFLVPDIFPASFRHQGHAPVYFEAAAMIVTLVLLGQLLERRAERKTGSALEALARLLPARASVVRDGAEQWVAIDDLRTGDTVTLRAGDRIPADGTVTGGQGHVDESMMTGEPFGADKATGDRLIAGTLLREGSLLLRVEQAGGATTLARIIDLVRSAQESRAPIQRVADRVTGNLVPVVLLIAAATGIAWWALGPAPSAWYGLLHAVTVLMITCPCALGLATPLSITTGIGRGALAGILIKDAAHLERLAAVNTIVFDKTGTLTTGQPQLHACIPAEPGGEARVLKLAAAVEQWSRHPFASAIVAGARQWGLAIEPASDFHSRAGGGVAGRSAGHDVRIGHREWIGGQAAAEPSALEPIARAYEEEGRSVVWVAVDGELAGVLVIADALKPHAAAAVHALGERGIRCLMLTGDSARAARNVARQVGISEVTAGVRPEEKARAVDTLRSAGAVVAMVGDGINDAPALAGADVGIAIGTGTEVAAASGQVNLLHGDLAGLVRAVDLSRAVMRNIRQNLVFAFAYNAVMIPLAAGAMFPWTGWMLTPMLASAAMSASSLTVIANALRLRRIGLDGMEAPDAGRAGGAINGSRRSGA